jgi:hypothetical protein
LQRKAKGQDLLDKVCDHIDLLEKDYFGLYYVDRQGYTVWVESDKRLSKQMKSKEGLKAFLFAEFTMLPLLFIDLIFLENFLPMNYSKS